VGVARAPSSIQRCSSAICSSLNGSSSSGIRSPCSPFTFAIIMLRAELPGRTTAPSFPPSSTSP